MRLYIARATGLDDMCSSKGYICLHEGEIMNVFVRFNVWAGKWRALLFQCAPLRIFLDAECKHISNACIFVYFEDVLIELKLLTQLFSLDLDEQINGKRYIIHSD